MDFTLWIMFYTYYFPAYTILISAFSFLVYIIGTLIIKSNLPKLYLIVGITACLLFLSYFKYLKMAINTINELCSWNSGTLFYEVPIILVPLGLFFFIFEFIHYLTDLYRGVAKQTTLLNFGSFCVLLSHTCCRSYKTI